MSNQKLNSIVGQDVKHHITMKIKRGNSCKGYIISWKMKAEDGQDYVLCGHSLCDKKDKYSQDNAYLIATNRAAKRFADESYEVPQSIRKEFNKMLSRMTSYYKDAIFPTWFVPVKREDKDATEQSV